MPNNLGELIERQRTKLGIQQKQVANMVGITNVSLCKVQTGKRKLGKKKKENSCRCITSKLHRSVAMCRL